MGSCAAAGGTQMSEAHRGIIGKVSQQVAGLTSEMGCVFWRAGAARRGGQKGKKTHGTVHSCLIHV